MEEPLLTECTLLPDDDCDSSYPDSCIPSPPPDLDSDDISSRSFKVIGNDPHGFNGDNDGMGCKSGRVVQATVEMEVIMVENVIFS